MIKLVVFDIDGVLTDGTILVDQSGREQKKINVKDIDAIFQLKRQGFLLAAVTGEDTEIVSYFRDRFPWDRFISGNKEKLHAVREIALQAGVTMEEIAYVGDGKYDVSVLPHVGLSLCPADAIHEAKLAADVVLSRPGGEGCLWELVNILAGFNQPHSFQRFFMDRLDEHRLLFHSLAADQPLMDNICHLAEKMTECIKRGGQILLCGNGGSAADAQHIAAEFIGRFYRERPALNAEALSVNTSTLTAIGNDYGFERVFVRQLKAKARSGDIVIGLSTSGTSSNVLEALRYAKSHDMTAAALTGRGKPQVLLEAAEIILNVPSEVTPRIQEAHIFIGHILAEYVESKLYGQ